MATAPVETVGLYVYGITFADVDCPCEFVDHGRLRVVVRPEALDQFEPEALEAALRDRSWLEERLRGHEEVLAAVLAGGPVVPFRFGTIFRTETELHATLEASEQQLAERLEELRGTTEWGVKTWADGSAIRRWLEEHDDHARALAEERDAMGRSPGRRYLLEKKLERHMATEAACLAHERAHTTHALLAQEARESTCDRPSGFDERGAQFPVLRAAYLVEDGARDAFERALAAARREDEAFGLEYVLTGPWPPYNFVDTPGR